MRLLILSIVILSTIISKNIRAQAFHFNDTLTTLVKSTDQSPAHWYLEIFNDTDSDTLLRWKADLSGIMPGWIISFDDQNNYYPSIMHNDSANFTLYAPPLYPQKLIIGNTLNLVAGIGSVKFCIYNPNEPAFKQWIIYEFIITPGALSVNVVSPLENVIIMEDQIDFGDDFMNGNFEIYSIQGSLHYSGTIDHSIQNIDITASGTYLIRVYFDGRVYSRKFIR